LSWGEYAGEYADDRYEHGTGLRSEPDYYDPVFATAYAYGNLMNATYNNSSNYTAPEPPAPKPKKKRTKVVDGGAFGHDPKLKDDVIFVQGNKIFRYNGDNDKAKYVSTLDDFEVPWDTVDTTAQHTKWGNKIYFFKGTEYMNWNFDTGKASKIKPISNWKLPSSWTKIDSAMHGNDWGNKMYFFRGGEYVYYQCDEKKLGPINKTLKNWLVPEEWYGKIDATFHHTKWGRKYYFVSGDKYFFFDAEDKTGLHGKF